MIAVYYIYMHLQNCSVCTAALTEVMKSNPFSLAVDGLNDTGVEKLHSLTVRIYDVNCRQVSTHLVDMCTTSGHDCGTSLAIFNKVDSVLVSRGIPWINCVGFGVDNTSVSIGLHNSLMTHVQKKVAACYFMGYACHPMHNIASSASDALQQESGFDMEDICVDVFYWFDKSTKHKGVLKEFCSFCDAAYHEVVRYVSVRWFSLHV